MMREWEAAQRRRETARAVVGSLVSYLAAGVVLTMPLWMILLGII